MLRGNFCNKQAVLIAIYFHYLFSEIGCFSKCATKSKYRLRPSMYSIESENGFILFFWSTHITMLFNVFTMIVFR